MYKKNNNNYYTNIQYYKYNNYKKYTQKYNYNSYNYNNQLKNDDQKNNINTNNNESENIIYIYYIYVYCNNYKKHEFTNILDNYCYSYRQRFINKKKKIDKHKLIEKQIYKNKIVYKYNKYDHIETCNVCLRKGQFKINIKNIFLNNLKYGDLEYKYIVHIEYYCTNIKNHFNNIKIYMYTKIYGCFFKRYLDDKNLYNYKYYLQTGENQLLLFYLNESKFQDCKECIFYKKLNNQDI